MKQTGLIPSSAPSVWQLHQDSRPPFPSIAQSGIDNADYLVIGGGYAGISAAFHLHRRFPGSKIVLAESGRIGSGASGRSGGQVLNWIAGFSRANPAVAKRTFDLTQQGMADLRTMAETVGASSALTWTGSLELYRTPGRARHAQAEVKRLNDVGLPFRYLDPQALTEYISPAGIEGAIFDPTAGQVDGPVLIEKAAKWLSQHGVSICEHSPVQKILRGEPAEVVFAANTVRAKNVVAAANAAIPRLGLLKNRVFPLHSLAIASEAHDAAFWSERGINMPIGFCDDRDRISYGCLTPGGQIVFGGGSNSAYHYLFGNKIEFKSDGESSFRAIEKLFKTYFPTTGDVSFPLRWSGVLDLTFDRCCSFGTIDGTSNIHYAAGFCGHGSVLAALSGHVIADICAGDIERWKEAPFFQHRLPWMPPEPFRWVGYHIFTVLTGRSPRKN